MATRIRNESDIEMSIMLPLCAASGETLAAKVELNIIANCTCVPAIFMRSIPLLAIRWTACQGALIS
jgi:hypothetical protein